MRISLVSYLNSYPYHYGLLKAKNKFYDKLDVICPASCAVNFEKNISDVALVPLGAAVNFDNYEILKPYCIAADGEVKSVLLLSNKPITEIESISLDADSRTSNLLVQILAKKHWHIKPSFLPPRSQADACVVIGDKAFTLSKRFKYCYDLATEWKTMSNLPFVFAVWVTKDNFDKSQLNSLTDALDFGINNLQAAIDCFGTAGLENDYALSYLTENINFLMNADCEDSIKLFKTYLSELNFL